jgi:hypothetical protein
MQPLTTCLPHASCVAVLFSRPHPPRRQILPFRSSTGDDEWTASSPCRGHRHVDAPCSSTTAGSRGTFRPCHSCRLYCGIDQIALYPQNSCCRAAGRSGCRNHAHLECCVEYLSKISSGPLSVHHCGPASVGAASRSRSSSLMGEFRRLSRLGEARLLRRPSSSLSLGVRSLVNSCLEGRGALAGAFADDSVADFGSASPPP